MHRGITALVIVGLLAAAAVVGATTLGPGNGTASSHREAPLIAEDPSADLTDLYAFRSPDKPNTVTILANVIPGEDPAAGPNWYTFSPNARYNLTIDTNGDARPNVTYRFQFRTKTGPFFLGDLFFFFFGSSSMAIFFFRLFFGASPSCFLRGIGRPLRPGRSPPRTMYSSPPCRWRR